MTLPVDPERLREEFPELSEDDLAAYVKVTKRVLKDPLRKGAVMKEVLSAARLAEGKKELGSPLTSEEELGVRYLKAVEKMQRSTVKRRGGPAPRDPAGRMGE